MIAAAKATRRKFFGLIAAGPIAGRAAADHVAQDLAGISMRSGISSGGVSGGPSSDPTQEQWRRALGNFATRETVESILYEEQYDISRIDPDIAVLRSFSLSAKVTYQRQRNVRRRIDNLQHGWTWQRLDQVARSWFGIKL